MPLTQHLKFAAKALSNVHRSGPKRDIFLFATPRGGSTWLMEIIASQPGIKFFDEPLSPRRPNVAYCGLFPNYEALMPGTGDSERIVGFLRDLQSGRRGYMNATPFQRNFRFLTNRALFKIHEIEHLIEQIEQRCNAHVVYLLRHPIATSISRHALPRLELFLRSEFYDRLLGDSDRIAEIRQLASSGTSLQKALVSWCYENLVALSQPRDTWLLLSYEELVLNPERSCDLLLDRLQLTDRNAMLAAFERPAVNITMSHAQTIEAMSNPDAKHRRHRLATKWMNQVSARDMDDAAEVLSAFAIDAYDARRPLPETRFLHFKDTERLVTSS
jgi:hypothetical protein